MTRFLTPFKRLMMVTLVVVSGTLLSKPLSAEASMNPLPVPLMLVGVGGTRTMYIVSTSNVFDSSHPSACGIDCYSLLRTTDGGAHFTVRTLPATSYSSDSLTGSLDQLVFANTRDGYALMGSGAPTALYVTHDGAGTWRRETIATGTTILGFSATHNAVYAVVAHCSASATCSKYRIARSSLAASKWTVSALPSWPLDVGVGIGSFESTVWLTQQSTRTVWLLTSHNLGKSFSRSSAPDLGSVYACHLTATSSTVLWAECPTGMAVSFFYSGDAGSKWNHIPTHLFAGTGGGYFDPVSGSLAYLAYGPADTPGSKNFFRITHEGLTMTAVGKLTCNIVNGLVFTDASRGFAACDKNNTFASTVLLRTSDGGATWNRATTFYPPL